jgi:steroid delta-isomerase-like uncharacterized protein
MADFRKLMFTAVAVAALGITSGTTGCNQPAPEENKGNAMADSTRMANEEMAKQFVDEVFNKGNMAFIDEHTAADFVEHTPSPGQEQGVESFKKFVAAWREAMPDLKFTVNEVVSEGDLVAIHVSQSGTLKSAAIFGPGTEGKHIDVSGIDLVRIKDGKMTEHWGYYEEAKMFQQLGLMPEMGAPPPGGAPATGDSTAKAMPDTTMKDTTKH